MPKSRPNLADETNGEVDIFSFIVRIWGEETTPEEEKISWRGHITPIPTGKRHYFSDIKDIPDFIAAHLKAHQEG